MKQGSRLEGFVHYVYSILARIERKNYFISKNTRIKGRSGAMHEFDVYYEFKNLNLVHKIAIECKDLNKPVSKGSIAEFHAKISDVGNVIGVMISKNGYQAGAIEYANHYDLILLKEEDLPKMNELLSLQIQSAFLPDESIIGEPFWTIMEYRNDVVTGTYICVPGIKENTIPLFFSKRVAESYKKLLVNENCEVRGINQLQLEALIRFNKEFIALKSNNISKFILFFFEGESNNKWPAIPISLEQLERDYLIL